MGDIITLLNGFNLSPLNTVLLAVLLFFLWKGYQGISCRLTTLEASQGKNATSIAFIKGRLGFKEDHDDDNEG